MRLHLEIYLKGNNESNSMSNNIFIKHDYNSGSMFFKILFSSQWKKQNEVFNMSLER